jgi:hypothetical protein
MSQFSKKKLESQIKKVKRSVVYVKVASDEGSNFVLRELAG